MLAGIDISHWQNDIDWLEIKRSGVKFAFIHATQFTDRSTNLEISPKLQINIKQASENDILWSAWHKFCTNIDPVIQAESFLQAIGEKTNLPPSIKINQSEIKPERLNYKLRLFLEHIETQTNQKAIICTSRDFWQTYLCCEKASMTDWARQYPLCLIQYHGMWPTPLYPWAGWDFWQYAENGKLPGVQTDVNMNWFNGGLEELMLLRTNKPDNDNHFREADDGNFNESENRENLDTFEKLSELSLRNTHQSNRNDREKLQLANNDHKPKNNNWVNDYFFHK